MKHARVLALLLALLTVAGCGSSSKLSATKLNRLVLAEGDLPSSFSAFANGPTATLDTHGTPRADPQRFGRQAGWVARFNRAGSSATKGPLVVVSAVDVFDSVGGAKRDFGAYGLQFQGQIADRLARPLAVGGLGEEAAALTSVSAGATPVRTFVIYWRHRNATAVVTANGFARRLEFKDVLRLARRQEQKLARFD